MLEERKEEENGGMGVCVCSLAVYIPFCQWTLVLVPRCLLGCHATFDDGT